MLTETPPDPPWTPVPPAPSSHPGHDADRDPPAGRADVPSPRQRGRDAGPERSTAIALLTDYLAAVADALRVEGFRVPHSRVVPGPLLHARLTLTPVEPGSDRPARITLAWAEDTGWSITHSGLRATPTPWRYLHSRLIPPPVAVAAFVTLVLTDTEEIAMLYPAQFRRHTQPLRPVIDALAEPGFAPSGRTEADPFEQHPENQ